jgi:mRNA-degrading endonuclease RelE of RelBE toxin-antitoxin system
MKYNVTTIPNFEKQYKRLWKKYPSLFEDVNALIESLESNPLQGSSLGNGLYKVRLSVTSKAQGKSGGARVITCVKVTGSLIVLVAIYDKSEQETVSPKELVKLLHLIP